MQKSKFIKKICISLILIGIMSCRLCASEWDDLVRFYNLKSDMTKEVNEYSEKLLQEAYNLSAEDLWRSLYQDLTPRQKAANGLSLLEKLCSGNIGKWENVKGFWYPTLIPQSLAVIDGFYILVLSLTELSDEPAPWLAYNLIHDLRSSSRGKFYFLETAPAEYELILKRLEKRGVPVPPHWFEFIKRGRLPLVRSFRGWISYNNVLFKNMVFFDSVGRPASNGYYAWDRDTGFIYEIATRERRRIFIPWN